MQDGVEGEIFLSGVEESAEKGLNSGEVSEKANLRGALPKNSDFFGNVLTFLRARSRSYLQGGDYLVISGLATNRSVFEQSLLLGDTCPSTCPASHCLRGFGSEPKGSARAKERVLFESDYHGLILRGHIDMIDDKDLDRTPRRFELQPNLFRERGKYRRTGIGL